MRVRHIQIPLLMLVLTAMACASFGGAAQTPTPAVQLTAAAAATQAARLPAATGTAPGDVATDAKPAAGTDLSNSGTADTPRLAYDASGTLHLVWFDKSARAGGDYFHRQLTAAGAWSTAENLTADFGDLYGDLNLLRDASGHMCVVFSAAKASADPATIGLYQRCQAGAAWAPADKLSVTTQTGVGVRDYSVVRAADGSVHALYIAGSSSVYFDNIQLSSDTLAAGGALAIDKAGGYHAVWVNEGSPFSVQYRFSSDQGQTWQPAVTLSTDQNAPDGGALSLVADGVGNVHLLWSGTDVFYRRWTSAAGWVAPVALAGGQNGPDQDLAVDAQGLARASWANHNGGLPYVLQAVSGQWSAPRILANVESAAPRLAVDAQGGSHVAWLTNQDVYYLAVP